MEESGRWSLEEGSCRNQKEWRGKFGCMKGVGEIRGLGMENGGIIGLHTTKY